MKGCFLLQRQFAYVGHALARLLMERDGVKGFCGYVYVRQGFDFLTSQTEVPYGTLLLDEEIHDRYKDEVLDPAFLDRLEKDYGIPNLWPYLKVDRVLMSNQLVREYPYDRSPYTHEELLRILQVHAKAVIGMLEKERPDFLIGSVFGGVGSLLLYHIAERMGVRTLNVLSTCIRDRWLLSGAYDTFTSVDARMAAPDAAIESSSAWTQAGAFLEEFRAKPIPYFKNSTPEHQSVTRRRQFRFLLPKNILRSISSYVGEVRRHLGGRERSDYDTIGPWNSLRDRLMRKARNLIGADDLYDEVVPGEEFAFFPLHYEPEVSLLLQAPFTTDQIHLIKQIARSLPVRMKLYVKEHPVMAEYRPRSYYKELKKIHNVKLIRPTVSSYTLIPDAKLVLTITGTVGWEAILLKKPVIMFGRWFYSTLPFVKRCTEMERLPSLVKEQLKGFRHDERELRRFLAYIFEDSAEIDLSRIWNEERDPERKKASLAPFADLLAKTLGLTYHSSDL
ncbi:MAG: hypothetical protein V1745_00790 [Patescibacteria group bacterium]